MDIFDGFAPVETESNCFVQFKEEVKNPDPPKIIYDQTTRETYRVLRKRVMDPVTFEEISEHRAFKYKYQWDPYTGETTGIDTDGPLSFDPDILIKHFHTKRLDKLYVMPKDETGGFYEGYYDDGVGAGEQFYVEGRGHHPEWYLFRLPINDCYVTEDHNRQHITFGPKLTDEEVAEIDRLANVSSSNYRKMFSKPRPSLTLMKKHYDMAISENPLTQEEMEGKTEDEIKLLKHQKNTEAVNYLINMRG